MAGLYLQKGQTAEFNLVKLRNLIWPNCGIGKIMYIFVIKNQNSKMKIYKQRVADRVLAKKLAGKGAVLIEGPKWCGKTTTAEQIVKSILYLSDPATKSQNLLMADINPQVLLQGETPRLIDEWQLAPKLWDAMRFEVDHRDEMGQFILTGSAVPPDTKEISHTGTGRVGWLMMRPMSLFESGESNGQISLKDLLSGPEQIVAENTMSISDIAYVICRGGWPKATDLKGETALEQAFDYYDAIIRSDISRVDGVSRNPERVKHLMRSYARLQGAQAPLSTILQDLEANESTTMDDKTLTSYLNALENIFVIENVSSWNPNLRSKTAIRTSDTRYFIDPSIGTAALGLGPNDLTADLNTLGLFFETLCMRDLRVFADTLDGNIYHYRDKNGLECDAVLHLRNGSYALIEIKLGGDNLIESGAESLKTLSDRINTDKMKHPAFLMVLIATGKYAYRRKDGVYVVPIGCLKD